jgi:hypothetical protein
MGYPAYLLDIGWWGVSLKDILYLHALTENKGVS